ncbi:MAG: D-aminoacylase [Anaerolineales bacterium]|nr:D-aminoacylase [Anaerolineales bacterium]
MLDICIKNGLLIDGTGKPGFKADVGVSSGRIVLIEDEIEIESELTIPAGGLVVSPGFIDPHSHSDLTLLIDPRAESKIRQGVTTEITGNCGDSAAPLVGTARDELLKMVEPYHLDVTWSRFDEYLDRLRSPGIALNVASLVGHNTIRGCVLGYDDVQPSPDELEKMKHLAAEAMSGGARGLSSGLIYPPGLYARAEEVIELARTVAEHDGIYASHVRNESDKLLEAVDEAIEIGEKAGIRVEISHLKLEGYRNWEGADRLLEKIDRANQRCTPVAADQYPYNASSTWLGSILPAWLQAGGSETITKRLEDPGMRESLIQDYNQNLAEWENRGCMHDWSDVIISNITQRPELQGKTILEIANDWNQAPIETALDLIVMSEASAGCIFISQMEENVEKLMQHPSVSIGSDGEALSIEGLLSQSHPHPRSFGAFPRVLGRYVREKKMLSLETAVKKMTSQTAGWFGLKGRGVIAENAWADLVLFDPNEIIDAATFTEPHCYPKGIPYVIVNGRIVIERGEHSGVLPGMIL